MSQRLSYEWLKVIRRSSLLFQPLAKRQYPILSPDAIQFHALPDDPKALTPSLSDSETLGSPPRQLLVMLPQQRHAGRFGLSSTPTSENERESWRGARWYFFRRSRSIIQQVPL